jgi:serine palmitoyltransferase
LLYRYSGEKYKAINLGSYNYLGFAQNNGIVADHVYETIQNYGVGVSTTHHELGSNKQLIIQIYN